MIERYAEDMTDPPLEMFRSRRQQAPSKIVEKLVDLRAEKVKKSPNGQKVCNADWRHGDPSFAFAESTPPRSTASFIFFRDENNNPVLSFLRRFATIHRQLQCYQ